MLARVTEAHVERRIERIAANGSCARCGRALDLASAEVDGRWYGNAACALDGPCPLEAREPAVDETSLYARPRRLMRRRMPKELRGA